jgi:hypothetical protein
MEQERAETMCWPWHWRQMTSQRWSERLPGTGRYQERIHSRYANLRLEGSDTVSVLTATKVVLHDRTRRFNHRPWRSAGNQGPRAVISCGDQAADDEGGSMRLAAGLVVLGLCLGVSAAHAEDQASDKWQFSIAPYLWATSLDGNVTVRGRRTDVDASFIDILQDTDSIIGIEGHAEAWKGRFGAYIDGIYNRLGADANPIDNFDVDTTVNLAVLEAGGLFRVGKWDLGHMPEALGGDMMSLALENYAGLRYTSLDISLDLKSDTEKRSEGGDKSWVDPLIGARTIIDLTERLQLMVGAAIGGFGVGSELTWSAIGLAGYKYTLFGLNMTTVIGYKALYQDYKDGSGDHRFKWDMTLHGPITGTIIKF